MDLAPRPAGGWQVGYRRRRVSPMEEGTLPDGRPDPCPDVCSVERLADGTFKVKHFLNGKRATAACCVYQVTTKPGESDVDALARADRFINRKHQE